MKEIKCKFNPVSGFVDIVNQFKKLGMVVAEIGTYDGSTSHKIAPIVKEMNGTFIAVDWFNGSVGVCPSGNGYDVNKHSPLLNQFKENIASVDCVDITKIYDMTSLDAANLIEDKSLDICFIDADHRYTSVKSDILAYIKKIKPGGILCGHDLEINHISKFNKFNEQELTTDFTNGCHAGVIQAVGEIIGFEKITCYSSNVWAVKID
jgi:hypothetical protein